MIFEIFISVKLIPIFSTYKENNYFSYLFIYIASVVFVFKMILRVDSNVNFEIRIQICSTPNSNSNTILNVSTIRYANTEIPYNYLENHPQNQIRIQTILKSIDKFARWRIISPSTFLESNHYPTLNDLHALFNPRLFVHSRDFSSPIVDAFPCQPIQPIPTILVSLSIERTKKVHGRYAKIRVYA